MKTKYKGYVLENEYKEGLEQIRKNAPKQFLASASCLHAKELLERKCLFPPEFGLKDTQLLIDVITVSQSFMSPAPASAWMLAMRDELENLFAFVDTGERAPGLGVYYARMTATIHNLFLDLGKGDGERPANRKLLKYIYEPFSVLSVMQGDIDVGRSNIIQQGFYDHLALRRLFTPVPVMWAHQELDPSYMTMFELTTGCKGNPKMIPPGLALYEAEFTREYDRLQRTNYDIFSNPAGPGWMLGSAERYT